MCPVACMNMEGMHAFCEGDGFTNHDVTAELLVYDNPLVSRYASAQMSFLFSPQRRHSLWRELWVALAQAEWELGVPGITAVWLSPPV